VSTGASAGSREQSARAKQLAAEALIIDDKTQEAKEVQRGHAGESLAREVVGSPPPTRPAPDPRTKSKRKSQKHKPKLTDLIAENDRLFR